MESKRRTTFISLLLLAVWILVAAWQVDEHRRVVAEGKNSLRKDSKAIATTLGAYIRGQRVRGTVFPERVVPVLNDLVLGYTNEVRHSSELISVILLNAASEPVAFAGRPFDPELKNILQENERWGAHSMTIVYPIEGAALTPDGTTNASSPVILAPPGGGPRGFPRRDGRSGPAGSSNVLNGVSVNIAATNIVDVRPPDEGTRPPGPPPDFGSTNGSGDRAESRPRDGDSRPRRPFWARGMDDKEYQETIKSRELHGLVLTMSTDSLLDIVLHDLWLRGIICFFAGISAVGVALAWGNVTKSSDLQIRLVRASELNTHLKEMNLAAAGLAHETRNPLNIIRGMAQMISKQPDAPEAIRDKTRTILDETDKVTAQLTEFINYSRPREVRRTTLPLNSVVNEIIHTLGHDIEEKKVKLETSGDIVSIDADNQLLRQALFNLIINAIQAVGQGGHIQVVTRKQSGTEAVIEIRDDGPGVPPERRTEIFKPYFTTQPKGTGLGLAVVQQIVLAHGWEIICLPNEPKGAIFRVSHLKLVT